MARERIDGRRATLSPETTEEMIASLLVSPAPSPAQEPEQAPEAAASESSTEVAAPQEEAPEPFDADLTQPYTYEDEPQLETAAPEEEPAAAEHAEDEPAEPAAATDQESPAPVAPAAEERPSSADAPLPTEDLTDVDEPTDTFDQVSSAPAFPAAAPYDEPSSEDASAFSDVDEPTDAFDQFSSEPSPFVVLQQDNMSFRHDRDDEGWESSAVGSQRYVPGGQRRLQEDFEQQSGPPMLTVAGVAVAVMVALCLALFHVLGLSNAPTTSETTQLAGTAVPKEEAEEVIASLDGWWKTDRALDGRYWHIEEKSVQTYAADGKLASENMLDETKVERMGIGPGGIEKPGYYLRDVGFFLVDDEPDTLYALAADGSADPDANLLRTEEPTFQSEEERKAEEEQKAKEAEYVLIDSDTRLYEYDELDAMDDHDLYLARYEIVARHGCIFKQGGELEAYFTQKSWYQPNEYYSEYDLSDIENQNLELIKSVEYNHGSQYQWS